MLGLGYSKSSDNNSQLSSFQLYIGSEVNCSNVEFTLTCGIYLFILALVLPSTINGKFNLTSERVFGKIESR
jgi:hypothetical protein